MHKYIHLHRKHLLSCISKMENLANNHFVRTQSCKISLLNTPLLEWRSTTTADYCVQTQEHFDTMDNRIYPLITVTHLLFVQIMRSLVLFGRPLGENREVDENETPASNACEPIFASSFIGDLKEVSVKRYFLNNMNQIAAYTRIHFTLFAYGRRK